MASATVPPGRRAMCQAMVRRKRLRVTGPSGSSGIVSLSSPCSRAQALTQVMNSAMRVLAALVVITWPVRRRLPLVTPWDASGRRRGGRGAPLSQCGWSGNRWLVVVSCSRTPMAVWTDGITVHCRASPSGAGVPSLRAALNLTPRRR